jgi:Asp-tRNA(Asn)/Glu-tRNA(Gln) amidotransferase A subunit family amidase
MTPLEICQLSAVELAAKIRAGECRSEEAVAACLEQIAKRDGEIGAWTHYDPDYAMDQARRADRQRGTGQPTGDLHGVPVGIKDIFDTADMPTEHGTPVFAGRRPTQDAAAVARLREAGAIILGKTVTTELAVFHPGKTRNPHDLERTPGGSSSGSAAAVAANMVPLALGTQTNGSVIRPASFCGVYGFKPSFGLVSRSGVLTQSPPLDTPGIFARGIEDIALATDLLSAYDAADRWMYPRSRGGHYDVATGEPPLPPLIGFAKTPFWERATADARDAYEELRDALGDHCEEVELPGVFASGELWHRQVMLADLARHFGPIVERSETALSDTMRSMIEEGFRVTAVEYNRAREQTELLYMTLADYFERYNALLVPAAPGPAPLGLQSTGNPIFSTVWTYLGVPAISLPLLEVDNMPLGAQLVGPRRDDARLLRTARWLVRYLVDNETAASAA